MKSLLIAATLILGSLQASAIIIDDRDDKVRYDKKDVQVILSCDAKDANVRDYYVLGRINHGDPQLFFQSRGMLTPAEKQRSMIYPESGNLFEIQSGYLTFLFEKKSYGGSTMLITNKLGQKIEVANCR